MRATRSLPVSRIFRRIWSSSVEAHAHSSVAALFEDRCNPTEVPPLGSEANQRCCERSEVCTYLRVCYFNRAYITATDIPFSNGSGFNAIEVGSFAGRASLIRPEDGLWLLEQWLAGVSITVSFPQTGGSVDFPLARGGLMSDFST